MHLFEIRDTKFLDYFELRDTTRYTFKSNFISQCMIIDKIDRRYVNLTYTEKRNLVIKYENMYFV